MQVHNLTKSNSSTASKRVGRGGKRGKTSGKGMKGQNARQGNSNRPELRDIIKKIPKLRGQGVHGNRNKAIMVDHTAVNVAQLQAAFPKGGLVTPKTLVEVGLAQKSKGKNPSVKILGQGEVSAKLRIIDCLVSTSAADKITAAGGQVTN